MAGTAAQPQYRMSPSIQGQKQEGTPIPVENAKPGSEGSPPTIELPPELQEYAGDPDDRKAMLLFRQAQQAERRRLEKARDKWLAAELRRQREVESRLKEEVGAGVPEAVSVGSGRAQSTLPDPFTTNSCPATEGGRAGRATGDCCRRGRPGEVRRAGEGLSCPGGCAVCDRRRVALGRICAETLFSWPFLTPLKPPSPPSPGCKTPKSSSWRGCS